jgi:L-cysteine S-thiosulfotransferase
MATSPAPVPVQPLRRTARSERGRAQPSPFGWRRLLAACTAATVLLATTSPAGGVPAGGVPADEGAALLQAMQQELEAAYRSQLPDVRDLHELARGVAAIDADIAESQAAMDDFPPWEPYVADGQAAWDTPFPDGARYADCFTGAVEGIRPRHPYFDESRGEVVTLDIALNRCRETHGLEPLPHGRAALNALIAWLSAQAAGKPIDIPTPASAAARAALTDGHDNFFARRGQLEFSCADCHVNAVGRRLRDVTLGPILGVAGRFPVYSLMGGVLGSLQARFQGCYRVTRAEPEALQSRSYRNLEYYLNGVSNGYPITGPGLLR